MRCDGVYNYYDVYYDERLQVATLSHDTSVHRVDKSLCGDTVQ